MKSEYRVTLETGDGRTFGYPTDRVSAHKEWKAINRAFRPFGCPPKIYVERSDDSGITWTPEPNTSNI